MHKTCSALPVIEVAALFRAVETEAPPQLPPGWPNEKQCVFTFRPPPSPITVDEVAR